MSEGPPISVGESRYFWTQFQLVESTDIGYVSFAENVRKLYADYESTRAFASSTDIDHSTVSRLLNERRNPSFTTAARVMRGTRLPNAVIYRMMMESVPPERRLDGQRIVFSDATQPVQGTLAEQINRYRQLRNISISVLASRVGLDKSTMSRFLRGERGRGSFLTTISTTAYVLGLNQAQTINLVDTVIPEADSSEMDQ